MRSQTWLAVLFLTFGVEAAKAQDLKEPVAPEDQAPIATDDFSWAPASYAPAESPFATRYFVPELRLDTAYHFSFHNPKDDTISGSSEVHRHGEVQITQIGVGGDFNYKDVGFRLMTQFGMYAMATPRNDASPARGQWQIDSAYRYISEAYASYHIDYLKGVNIQAGLFMSYIGLWSYYNFDNWTYQPSYVSSNTPWFFNGVRAQIFVNDKFKVEPYLVNGWQSYGRFNDAPGVGVQLAYRPNTSLSMVGNQYYGADTLGNAGRKRIHTDDSIMFKYYENKGATVSRAAASLTLDAGCEEGGGVTCGDQYFLGFMAYNRLWFAENRYGLTVGGGAINNRGRYLVIMPPINGATAYSGTPFFSAQPGDDYKAWDVQVAGDYMPTRNLTFRLEFNHRHANVPYFSGPNGVTPPGGNVGAPGSDPGTGWAPDLRKYENRVTAAMMVRF